MATYYAIKIKINFDPVQYHAIALNLIFCFIYLDESQSCTLHAHTHPLDVCFAREKIQRCVRKNVLQTETIQKKKENASLTLLVHFACLKQLTSSM